jgi:hypothetical protein
MKKYLLITIGMLLLSPSAFSAGYGDAGCGLGSLLFGDKPGPIQILAATTNSSTWNQDFGITSGTSNCDAKGFDTATLEQERFVASNFASLAKDMASGEGEQLAALAGLLGCPALQQTRFNTVAQKNYNAIFANDGATPAHVLTATKGVVSRDAELSVTCIN